MTTSAPSGNGDRLNGWKEIAAHLGKGPRTAQRWEKEYGLPVHRVGREGGEIVFAFRDEIDRWSRRASARETLPDVDAPTDTTSDPAIETTPRVLPRVAGRLRIGLGIAGAVAAIVLSWFFIRHSWSPANPAAAEAGPPAAWRLANGALTVLDEHGRQVFRREFDFSLTGAASSAEPPRRDSLVRIVDLDGDGRPEVLLRAPADRREDRRFYCFESDGRLRFVDEPRGRARFGATEYGEPWLAHRFFVPGSGPRRSLYVADTHNLWFPARVRRLDQVGRLVGEYWSNGYVELVDETTWRGRAVALVGGVGNDASGGSLAIFDPPAVAGHSPSLDEEHRCHGCPDGGPVARLTFPTMCVLRGTGGLATVVDAWVESGDRLTVSVLQGFGRDSGGRDGDVVVFYTFGPDLSLVHADVSPEFRALHTALEKQGTIDHALGARDEADMFPVRLFDASGVRVLKPVRVVR